MSEVLPAPERLLWHEGPNLTADAVVFDTVSEAILLIQRRDTGEWALPGGFIDGDESALLAAIREAEEEAGVILEGGSLVFQGKVDDPRNSDAAWIETTAYLFEVARDITIHAGDDAASVKWFTAATLPDLYASHRSIVEIALTIRK